MVEKIQSAGWIVYFTDAVSKEQRFLLIKRHALSKKVERVAPKGKIQNGEKPEQAATREICEETSLARENLIVKQVLDTLSLQLYNDKGRLGVDKDITYFLVQYTWDPKAVKIIEGEWFLGMYKRATLQEVLGLVHYKDLRELFRIAHGMIGKLTVRDDFIKNF